jgi:hypothetical protein
MALLINPGNTQCAPPQNTLPILRYSPRDPTLTFTPSRATPPTHNHGSACPWLLAKGLPTPQGVTLLLAGRNSAPSPANNIIPPNNIHAKRCPTQTFT